jgi:prolyl-tRNA synthetase
MRAREFIMKDGYSFHASFADLEREYGNMYDTYCRIFTRLGLQFRAVAADTGSIGGTGSHEFHVIAETGEDTIAYCPTSDYAANIELAEALPPATPRPAPSQPLALVETPGVKTITELVAALGVPITQTVKSVVVNGEGGEPVLLLLRGDHELNEVKAEKLAGVEKPLTFTSEAAIRATFGAGPGSLGPVGFRGRIVADRTVATMADFVTGANRDGYHYTGVNIGRDFPEPEVADLRNVVAGDPSPDGKGVLALCKGIEVGHIFQLRTKYSAALKCHFLDESGQERPMEMGCYGIGVTRIVGAAIEQNHDERGIIWPEAIAPFEAVICPIGAAKNPAVDEAAARLYDELVAAGLDVILDDRGERPGVMFADWELIGVPWRVVVSERGLAAGTLEIRHRRAPQSEVLPWAEAVARVTAAVAAAKGK